MEISPIIAQDALRGLERVVFFTGILITALAVGRSAVASGARPVRAIGHRAGQLRSFVTWRALPVLGLPTLLPTTAVAPQTPSFTRLDHISSGNWIEPPWAGVSGFSPPRLLARPHGPTENAAPAPIRDAVASHVHPAIHGTRGIVRSLEHSDTHPRRAVSPLFPRAQTTSGQAVTRSRVRIPIGKRRAMRIHPAGSGLTRADGSLRRAQRGRRHVVRQGDTLWGIAEDVLKTSDTRRIARYWPKLHRANLDVIGRDPNLIYPGQVLHLPPEK